MQDLDLPEVVIDGLTLPECPRWHGGSLYFSDVKEGRAMRLAPDRTIEQLLYVEDEHVGGLGFLPDGTLLAVLQKRRAVVRVQDGGFEILADLHDLTRFMVNDMITFGDFAFVSQPGFDVFAGRPEGGPETTDILFVGPDGTARIVASDVAGPNGMAITADGGTLYVAECGRRQILTFPVAADGMLGERKVLASFADDAIPDGICIDDTGAVWAACPLVGSPHWSAGPGVVRIARDGSATHRVPMAPGRRAVACALGGKDRDLLYICTAEEVIGEHAFAPGLGRIECVRVPFAGAGLP